MEFFQRHLKAVLSCLVVTSSLGFLPLKTQAETKTVLRCTTDQFYIQVKYDTSNGRYTYIAYQGAVSDQSSPSLVLHHGVRSGNRYIFKNGDYSYIVGSYLSVVHNGKKELNEECHPTD